MAVVIHSVPSWCYHQQQQTIKPTHLPSAQIYLLSSLQPPILIPLPHHSLTTNPPPKQTHRSPYYNPKNKKKKKKKMTTPADLVPPPEGTLTTPQIDGIRIMRKTLLGSPSYDEVWQTLSMTSDAINLDVPSLLLWQEEGQKRRNALFYLIDEGEEG